MEKRAQEGKRVWFVTERLGNFVIQTEWITATSRRESLALYERKHTLSTITSHAMKGE